MLFLFVYKNNTKLNKAKKTYDQIVKEMSEIIDNVTCQLNQIKTQNEDKSEWWKVSWFQTESKKCKESILKFQQACLKFKTTSQKDLIRKVQIGKICVCVQVYK